MYRAQVSPEGLTVMAPPTMAYDVRGMVIGGWLVRPAHHRLARNVPRNGVRPVLAQILFGPVICIKPSTALRVTIAVVVVFVEVSLLIFLLTELMSI